jgi:hypothetical protein
MSSKVLSPELDPINWPVPMPYFSQFDGGGCCLHPGCKFIDPQLNYPEGYRRYIQHYYLEHLNRNWSA